MNKKEPRADGHIEVENHGAVLVARIDGGPHALFDAALTKQLKELVDRADRDPNIHAVVLTRTVDPLLTMSQATGRNLRQRFWLVLAPQGLRRFAVDCHRLQPRGSF